ncbi:MAG: 30S ribosomal protein S20 [Deltaproteobacteria bacterium]|nr:30S ribosomal protein S20 [Deltaproteobacteria bacterium]
MANHASALKRHRQSERRQARNASVKSAIKSTVRKVREAVEAGKPEDANTLLKSAMSTLDGAVSKGVLHRNNASRKVARLTSQVNALKAK